MTATGNNHVAKRFQPLLVGFRQKVHKPQVNGQFIPPVPLDLSRRQEAVQGLQLDTLNDFEIYWAHLVRFKSRKNLSQINVLPKRANLFVRQEEDTATVRLSQKFVYHHHIVILVAAVCKKVKLSTELANQPAPDWWWPNARSNHGRRTPPMCKEIQPRKNHGWLSKKERISAQ